MLTKMDKIWISAAILTRESIKLIEINTLKNKYQELFSEEYPASLEQQITSWKRRYFDPKKITQGGSRNRYLFRTVDGETPNSRGGFRLYLQADGIYDGENKAGGPIHPNPEKIPESFRNLIAWYKDEYNKSEQYSSWLANHILQSCKLTTEKMALAKARIGQGIFRDAALQKMPFCVFTKIANPSLLRASHIKPWASCSNAERLDGENCLILAPHLDHLFDRGFITFEANGKLIVTDEAQEAITSWHIERNTCLPMSDKKKEYMAYHRDYLFIKNN